jgi:hypothetical protein
MSLSQGLSSTTRIDPSGPPPPADVRPTRNVKIYRKESARAGEQDRGGSLEVLDRCPLSTKQRRQLAGLGLTVDDYRFLLRRFVGHRFDYSIRKIKGDEWYLTRKRPLSHALLISHLKCRRFVATGCRWDSEKRKLRTDYFAIDLDYHGDSDSLFSRYDRVVAALGKPTFLFQSSSSGGLHLYYLLDQSVDLHLLRTPDGKRGAVMQRLAGRGIREEAGSVEFYPRGHYIRRGVQPRFRLPFGAGSRLLDLESLLPLGNKRPAHNVVLARELFEAGKVQTVDSVALVSIDYSKRPRPPKRPYRRKKNPALGEPPLCASTSAGTDALWRTGLTRGGQFNSAIVALAFDLHRRGAAQWTAVEQIKRWLRDFHNYQSRTYTKSQARAFAEIESVAARVYAGGSTLGPAPRPDLTAAESLLVLDTFGSDAVDPTTGEVVCRFKVEHFVFELLRSAKKWVLGHGQQAWERVKRTHPELIVGSLEYMKQVRNGVAHFWPDPTQPEFHVPIPYALRTRLIGISEASQWPLWRAAQGAGLFPRVRVANPWTGRAATYRVRLDFGHTSADQRSYSTLSEAAGALLTQSEKRGRYTRHYCDRIQKEADLAAGIVRSAPIISPFETLVRYSFRENGVGAVRAA